MRVLDVNVGVQATKRRREKMKNANPINREMYQALKTAQVVIKALLFNAPDTYKAQQDMIQNALDTAEARQGETTA